MVTAEGVLLPSSSKPEDWTTVRRYRPPFWCTSCEVGQSIERCWICAETCKATTGRAPIHKPGSLPAREMPGASVFIPTEPDE